MEKENREQNKTREREKPKKCHRPNNQNKQGKENKTKKIGKPQKRVTDRIKKGEKKEQKHTQWGTLKTKDAGDACPNL